MDIQLQRSSRKRKIRLALMAFFACAFIWLVRASNMALDVKSKTKTFIMQSNDHSKADNLESTKSAAKGFATIRSSVPTNRVSLLLEWLNNSMTETNDTRLIRVFFTPSVVISIKKGKGHSSLYETIIVEFSARDKIQAIEHLLSSGANPNEILNSMTVLDWAIKSRDRKVIWLLLGSKWGAQLSLSTLEAAHQTAREQDDDIVCLRINQLMKEKKQKTASEQ